jgi:hypothetical protein
MGNLTTHQPPFKTKRNGYNQNKQKGKCIH